MGAETSVPDHFDRETSGYRVLNVQPGSPGEAANFDPYFCFIISAAGVRLDQDDRRFTDTISKYLQEKNINAQACIVLTDGHLFGGWGNWSLPTLWCILDNEGTTSDVGKTVHINSEDM